MLKLLCELVSSMLDYGGYIVQTLHERTFCRRAGENHPCLAGNIDNLLRLCSTQLYDLEVRI